MWRNLGPMWRILKDNLIRVTQIKHILMTKLMVFAAIFWRRENKTARVLINIYSSIIRRGTLQIKKLKNLSACAPLLLYLHKKICIFIFSQPLSPRNRFADRVDFK